MHLGACSPPRITASWLPAGRPEPPTDNALGTVQEVHLAELPPSVLSPVRPPVLPLILPPSLRSYSCPPSLPSFLPSSLWSFLPSSSRPSSRPPFHPSSRPQSELPLRSCLQGSAGCAGGSGWGWFPSGAGQTAGPPTFSPGSALRGQKGQRPQQGGDPLGLVPPVLAAGEGLAFHNPNSDRLGAGAPRQLCTSNWGGCAPEIAHRQPRTTPLIASTNSHAVPQTQGWG